MRFLTPCYHHKYYCCYYNHVWLWQILAWLSFDIQQIAYLRGAQNFDNLYCKQKNNPYLRKYDLLNWTTNGESMRKVGRFSFRAAFFPIWQWFSFMRSISDRFSWDLKQACVERENFRTSCHWIKANCCGFEVSRVNFIPAWPRSSLIIEYTFLALMFCFHNSDHVMFSREFAFCLCINYAYTGTWMQVHKTKLEKKNSSLGYHHVVWNGKTKLTS